MDYFLLYCSVFVKLHPRRTKSLSYVVISLGPHFPFPKSFSCNTYVAPGKCCKQKTYSLAKPFRCNTYKKHGGGGYSSHFGKPCAVIATRTRFSFKFFLFTFLRTLLHLPKTQLSYFQAIPHSSAQNTRVGGCPASRSAHCRSQKGTLNMSEPACRKASFLPYLLTSLLPSFPLVDRWAKAGDNFKTAILAGVGRDLEDANVLLKGANDLEDGYCLTETT